MNISLKVISVNIRSKAICNSIMNDRGLWTYAATQWHRLYTPYVPMQTGMLTGTVTIRPKEIEHTVPYARYQYNGTGFHFRKDQHPKACAQWDRKAEASQKPKLIRLMQSYIDGGGVKLNG